MGEPSTQVPENEKRCPGCDVAKPLSAFGRRSNRPGGVESRCRDCMSEYRKQRYDPEKESARHLRQRQADDFREKAREYDRQRNQADPERPRSDARRWRASLRQQAFDHYGWTCACCGATARLVIDHIEGNGKEHRQELFGHSVGCGSRFYSWLIQNGFPDDLQTLCRPCNSSKKTGDRCRLDHSALPGPGAAEAAAA